MRQVLFYAGSSGVEMAMVENDTPVMNFTKNCVPFRQTQFPYFSSFSSTLMSPSAKAAG